MYGRNEAASPLAESLSVPLPCRSPGLPLFLSSSSRVLAPVATARILGGTIVSATVYGSAQIQFWDERIIQYKRYYVSGATVQQANPLYQISDYGFTWTIQKGTLVEEYPEKLPPQLPCEIHLQEYSKLSMSRFTLGIEDNTGLIQAVISGPEAEQLLPMTAAQMSLNKNQLENAMEVEANFQKKQITCYVRHYISEYQDKNESNFAVVVVYVNEDNIEDMLPLDETNTSVHSQRLGKQVAVEEQLTPTAHKVLASILNTPSPITLEKQNKQGAKRSINFDLETNEPTDADQVEADHPEGPVSGGSTKRQKKNP
ncbi:glycine decarboxylase P-protein 1 [Striga asiatica]|uniref:Glycine decarboxylase P-protein 1 n=1 Tax=Striga asiatica TaxID=4170 RepID=A0A5A7R1G6_STRAF|nr:glycine decarboxylase P-protein 1 [Striga asiatica]